MATTISSADDTLTPILVEGWSSARESGNYLHHVIGATSPAVTVRPARLRTGTIRSLWATLALAAEAEAMLAAGGVFTLADSDRPEVAMSFVIADDGDIVLTLDPETRVLALVTFDFAEVVV